MQGKRHPGRKALRALDQGQAAKDINTLASSVLWEMLDRNLIRMTLAWEGGMSQREQENRLRLCMTISRELRDRSQQLTLDL